MPVSPFEQLVASAKLLTGVEIFDRVTGPSVHELEQFLDANRDHLRDAHAALQKNCVARLQYEASFLETHVPDLGSLRNLVRAFAADVDSCARAGELDDAIDVGMAIFDLANVARSGGLVVDGLIGIAYESAAINRMRRIRTLLSVDQASRVANELLRVEAQREPFGDIVTRDQEWEKRVGYVEDGTNFTNTDWAGDDPDIDEEMHQTLAVLQESFAETSTEGLRAVEKQLDDRNIALLRLLALEAALYAFRGRHGAYPPTLGELMPDYIAMVPGDPCTGTNFCYRATADGFTVYSRGPRGMDRGGTPGSWTRVLTGEADLRLDMFDYQELS